MNYGRYKIVERLGKGSVGEVYLAHDPRIDRKVALKVLHKEHLASKEIIKRFIKEAKAIGRLSHPNIVSVYDVGKDRGTIYIAMEYLEGRPLNEVIQSKKKLDMASIVGIGRQVAAALDYAHQKGIVHRDVKPSNLMITDTNQVKLTDFGIAHFEDASITLQTCSGDILGTPAYMPPEQVAGQDVDGRSDLYSLGVILYELIVGRRPFVENTLTALFKAITQHSLIPPEKVNPSIPSELSDIVLKSMDKNPERRYQSGAELISALSAYLPGAKTDLKPPGGKQKAMRLGWAAILMVAGVICWQVYDYMNTDQPVTAFVDISSEPSNASIYLNNTFKGTTPMRCELPLGMYDLRLTLAEHYESEARIDVGESGEMPVHLRLIPKE
ncbi:MAG: serine/threonine-protein kinase [Desulfobacteraceae bacterium]|jgi:serine/threonine-protein kinase